MQHKLYIEKKISIVMCFTPENFSYCKIISCKQIKETKVKNLFKLPFCYKKFILLSNCAIYTIMGEFVKFL